MASQLRRSRLVPRTLALATGIAALVALTACSPGAAAPGDDSSSKYGFETAEQDASAPITVWVDSSREPIAKAFQAANPDITVNIETYDGNSGGSDSFKTKIALFDQSDSGWPDVVFSTQQNDTSWASVSNNGGEPFAAILNKGLLSDDFLNGFTKGALDPMTVDGNVYGVRNDLAPVVYWYNDALMKEFGYDVPQTWEDYEALSDKVAEEHPGYILGSVGDSFQGPYIYYWGGEAPIFQVKDGTFTSDFSDPNSEKVTKLLDHMIANKTLVNDSVFGAEFVQKYGDKILGMPGPAWYSGALFQNKDSLNSPAGTIGASAPLYWDGSDKVTGNVGGGVWYGSSHSTNLDAVAKFLEFVTSSDDAVKLASGLPAYDSAATTWLDQQANSGYYVGDFASAVSTAASSVWSGWSYPSFSVETAYASVVIPGISDGKTMAELVPALQKEYENQATVQGYTVK